MKADVVIGANFGDEGKGLVTDYLCSVSQKPTTVVRFNGGAQAGHTVVDPKAGRFVFHHIGAGSFVGASTYLHTTFIVDPVAWLREWRQWTAAKRTIRGIAVSPHAFLSVPYDWMLNHTAEKIRVQRHGSCGLGIHETMVRCEEQDTLTCASDLNLDVADFRERVKGLRGYALRRLENMRVSDKMYVQVGRLIQDNSLLEEYVDAAIKLRHCLSVSPDTLAKDHLVFEGAQGLGLDQRHEFFPYVTHSNTGLTNVVQWKQTAVDELDVYYVMRPYATRHGPGPFPTERSDLRYYDNTNCKNEYQGELRFGTFDVELVSKNILRDLKEALQTTDKTIHPRLVITHMDEVGHDEGMKVWHDIEDATGLKVALTSYGPTRNDVRTT